MAEPVNKLARKQEQSKRREKRNDNKDVKGRTKIQGHEGRKYLRQIYPASDIMQDPIDIDVYCVLEAFDVTCPARAHAIKKLLCCGTRGKGNELADLEGVLAAVNRAIELQELRDDE